MCILYGMMNCIIVMEYFQELLDHFDNNVDHLYI